MVQKSVDLNIQCVQCVLCKTPIKSDVLKPQNTAQCSIMIGYLRVFIKAFTLGPFATCFSGKEQFI
jgi:hypothetical protein